MKVRAAGPFHAHRRPRPSAGEEHVRQIVMAQACFVANTGVDPAIPQTIEIRPLQERVATTS